MENSKSSEIKFLTRDQLLEIAKNFEPIAMKEEGDSGSILRKFCIGAYSSMKGLKRTKANSDRAMSAVVAVKDYVRNTPEFASVLRFVGQGSSRITFALQDGSALKFAYNAAGIAQNKKEAQMMQVDGDKRIPCFPRVYEHTEDWRGMLVECCSPMKEEDARVYSPLGDFYNFTSAIHYLIDEKKKFFDGDTLSFKDGVTSKYVGKVLSVMIEGEDNYTDVYQLFVDRLISSDKGQWNSLRALVQILLKFADRSVLADLENIENWGLIINRENGDVIPVVVDMGFDEDIWNRFYRR